MQIKSKNKFYSLFMIHIAVLLFGLSGLFGKFLSISPLLIVFGRTLFASLFLILMLLFNRTNFRLDRAKDVFSFVLMGAILAIHWTSFFYAIQIATVAIGLLSFSTFPIFVTFLEPVFFKEPLRRTDILVSIVIFFGLLLVIPEFDLSNHFTIGVIWGLISGFTFALLAILNRKFVANYSALTIALYQNSIACTLLLPITGSAILTISTADLKLLILLGVVFTAIAHSLYIKGMMVIKAQLASLITCLEPIYGIVFAFILLNETPMMKEIVGGIIIIGTILFATNRTNLPNDKQA